MKLFLIGVAAMLVQQAAFGADKKPEMEPMRAVARKGAKPKAATDSTNPSNTLYTASPSFTIPPGTSFKITSEYDYTGAAHVSVAIECPTGNSLQSVGIAVWWGNPLATYLTMTDYIPGNGFALSNMGGATVPVYGTQLVIQVVNAGPTPVSCDQVTTYAVVH
jgi:hypothetical protein